MTQTPSGPPPEARTQSDTTPGAAASDPTQGHDGIHDQGPRATKDEIRDLGRLRRTVGPHRKISGVAGGLARHLDIDPLIVRVLLVVLIFFGGSGLIIYAAAWLLVPEDGAPRPPFGFDDRNRSIALVIAGTIAALALIGDSLGQVGFPWPLLVIGLIALLAIGVFGGDRPRPTAPPVPHAPPTGGAPWPYAAPAAPGVSPGANPPGAAFAPPTPPPGEAPAPAGYASYPQNPPTYVGYAPTPLPPKKRGPKLFWFTAALSALAVGLLGIVDLAGAGVADSAYPALVLAICGAMLLVGAFYGRAGGIILIGLIAAIGTAGATAGDRVDTRDIVAPVTAEGVQSTYQFGLGELVLDLTDVEDLESLDGRTISIDVGAGSIEVIVPEGLDINARAQVGLGDVSLLGQRQEGAGIDASAGSGSGIGAPELTIDIELGLGEVSVVTEAASTSETEGATR